MNKSFYFRKSSTLTDDDDNNNSLLVPVNRVFHMIADSATMTMYFKGLIEKPEEYQVEPNGVVLVVSSGTAKTIMESIANEVDNGEDSVITIFDGVTGDKVDSNISSILLFQIDES